MITRVVDIEKDYPDLKSWWDYYEDWEPIPKELLPPTGYIVEKNGVPCSAAWLYISNSPCAWMEWVIANPEVDKYTRGKSLIKLFEHITTIADISGIKTIFHATNVETLIKGLKKHGFMEVERLNLLIRKTGD